MFGYRGLRRIIVTGYVIGLILFFLTIDSDYSELEQARYCLNGADGALGLWHLATLAARIGFLALIIFQPRRWVFVSGAAWAALVLLSNYVSGNLGGPVDNILNHAQLLMRMSGFFARPSAPVTNGLNGAVPGKS